jgi:hypothetical protein
MGKVPKHNCDRVNPEASGCHGTQASTPWWGLICHTCLGEGSVDNVRCETCNGTGLVGMDVCPNSINTGSMDAFFMTWRYSLDGLQPNTGGSLDLGKDYLDARDFANTLKSKIEYKNAVEQAIKFGRGKSG